MQPYLFPYLGYYQLMAASDRFVIYDDVSFIKQGWINKNRILVNGAPHTFTMPVANASSNADINELHLDQRLYSAWRVKFLRTLDQSYRKAPFQRRTLELVAGVLQEEPTSLSGLLGHSLESMKEFLGLSCTIVRSSSIYLNKELRSTARILDICRQERADTYINPIGGIDLYDRSAFERNGIDLKFLKSRLPAYDQGTGVFVPGLSIIDLLMYNDEQGMKDQLEEYDLL